MSIGSLVRLDLGMDKSDEQELPFQQQQLSEDQMLHQPQASKLPDLPQPLSTQDQEFPEQSASKDPEYQDLSPMEDDAMEEDSPQLQYEIGLKSQTQCCIQHHSQEGAMGHLHPHA